MSQDFSQSFDFVIIGAGIIGLTLAYSLKQKFTHAKIVILEKEKSIGLHASGRNSGVLHSGIYYPSQSLKSKLCIEGFNYLKSYCLEYDLPLDQCGKVVVCAKPQDIQSLHTIHERAQANNVPIELIDNQQLKELEPLARSTVNKALWVPGTSVFDPKAILNKLRDQLIALGVKIIYETNISRFIPEKSLVLLNSNKIYYGHLFNTAGLFADSIAKCFNLNQYSILPFKGLYYYLSDNPELQIKRLIYPAPDINLPFLGIHVTKNINNKLTVGPSAFPALGRENYSGIKNINIKELLKITPKLLQQYYLNKNNFRNFTHNEVINFYSKTSFLNNIKRIFPIINKSHITTATKVGIRAQLLDLKKKELIMDLLIKKSNNSTHVLNAVSPAFTCSFAMAKFITNEI